MPNMDGAETTQNIKSVVKDWDFSPLIVGCSADNSQQTQRKFLQAGVSHFLNKPITASSISGLNNLLKCYLNKPTTKNSYNSHLNQNNNSQSKK